MWSRVAHRCLIGSLVFGSVLLGPVAGWAEQSETDGETSAADTDAHEGSADASPDGEELEPPGRVQRMAVMTVWGTVAMVATAGVGLLLAGGLAYAGLVDSFRNPYVFGAVAGAVFGAGTVAATTATIYKIGTGHYEYTGGYGAGFATIGGILLGATTSVVAWAGLSSAVHSMGGHRGSSRFGAAAGLLIPVLVAVPAFAGTLGFELAAEPPLAGGDRDGMQVQPNLGIVSGTDRGDHPGVVFGLGGRF